MHELAFADATRPTPVSVLKLPLRTFTLGHELLLLRQRNAFMLLPESDFNALLWPWQRLQLQRAVLVCYRDWEGNQKPERFLKLWNWFTRNADLRVAIADFRNYLAEHRQLLPSLSSDVPEDAEAYQIANRGEEIGGGRSLGAPMLAQLVNFAQERRLGTELGFQTLWDVPYALAGNLYFTDLERNGQMHIENFREREEREAMAKHRADVANEKAAEAAAAAAGKT